MERAGATLGVVLAGLAAVAALLPWPGSVPTVAGVPVVALALGSVGVVAFSARRRGVADRATGAAVAGAASAAVAIYAGYALLTAGDGAAVLGVGLAALGGVGGTLAAYSDWRSVPADRVRKALTAGLAAAFVGFSGLAVVSVWQVVLYVPLTAVVGEPSETALTALGTVALGLGTATVAGGYIVLTDRDLGFVDARVPTLRHVGYAVAGVVVIFAALLGVQLVYTVAGVDATSHGIAQQAEGNPAILLVLIPASWLLVGPGEELLYRNVVQKSLYGVLPRWGAVFVASLVFAVVHFSAFGGATLVGTLASLALVFVLSLVLGILFVRTENVVVPAFVHGTFNAVQFAFLYVELTGGV
jgi:membrane protease YdiL (CAAX protease family)